jgi:hypothetical protein
MGDMTRMMPALMTGGPGRDRIFTGRIGRTGRRVTRAVELGAATVELFPPVVLVGGLALYFYMLACMDRGGE